MRLCARCLKLLPDRVLPCFQCFQYHCVQCCRAAVHDHGPFTLPILSLGLPPTATIEPSSPPSQPQSDDTLVPSKGGSGTPPPQNDWGYLKGAAALGLLGAWIYYSTITERRRSGAGHWKTEAVRELDHISKLLSSQQGVVPRTIGVFPWELYKTGFRLGADPTPMPFPSVFASMADFKLTIRLGLFSMFAKAEDFAKLENIVTGNRIKQALPSASESLVRGRSSVVRWAGSGFFSGSAALSFLTGKIPIYNHPIMMVQLPWDTAMIFNQFAVSVGESSRILIQAKPLQFRQAQVVIQEAIRPALNRMMGIGLGGVAIGVGIGVPYLMTKYLSDGKRGKGP